MAIIWANRLIAGTKTWSEVPLTRKNDVRTELRNRVESGAITEEQYQQITGEDY